MGLVYFSGLDADGNHELWRTDGTAGGTIELTPNAGFVDGFDDLGLYPQSIVVDGAQVLFAGRDPTTNTNTVWRYTSTTGAVELTVAGATTDTSGAGFAPEGLALYNGKVYFSGYDTTDTRVLWSTDGTSSGTAQASPYNPIASPAGMTVAGSQLYFSGMTGANAALAYHLYAMNASGGIAVVGNLPAKSLIALGSLLLFEGPDPYGLYITRGELYVYNPVNGGVTRLTSPGAGPADDSDTFRDEDASFVLLGNEIIFRTADSVLSVSDGTVTGTHAITGIVGANGGFYGPLGAVIGKVLLFRETDMANVAGLWASDGTGAGTHEITVLGAAAAGVQPTNITAISATAAVFTGINAAGQSGLWITDGTTAGTHELTGIRGAATTGIDPASFSASVPFATAVNDISGDGRSDLVWRNDNGDLVTYTATGSGFTSKDFGLIGTAWVNQPGGDFTGDGKSDLLWRNVNGDLVVWSSTGANFTSKDYGVIGTDWSIQGTGDYTGDGRADILWRNNDGTVVTYTSTGSGFASRTIGKVGNDWHIQKGTADLDGDGKADVLWRNDNGEVATWTSTGAGFASHDIGKVSLDWSIQGTGDFDGDGRSDILWRNADGEVDIWHSTGTGFAGQDIGKVGNDWHIAQVGDFNGDGKSDIAWRNDNGDLNLWTASGSGFTSKDFGIVSKDWHIVG